MLPFLYFTNAISITLFRNRHKRKHRNITNFAARWGTRMDTKVSTLVNPASFIPNPAKIRDRRPLREGERQRIFPAAGAHSVRPFLYLYAMPDTVLLHISAALRKCSTAVPHNSFACCYRRHPALRLNINLYLRIESVLQIICILHHQTQKRRMKTIWSILHFPFSITANKKRTASAVLFAHFASNP